ncbi:MAG: Peptidase [Humibacillus sp.]|nr:Peptidase [Humibacillus sp.]
MSPGSAVLSLVLSLASSASALAGAPSVPPSLSASAAKSAGVWSWPLQPEPRVVRGFDPPDRPWLAGHRGVDLAAAVGQTVHSPAPGTVTYAGRLAGRGVLVVTHAGGLRSTFEPVAATSAVGTSVAESAPVGTVSAEPGHCAPATCLHWGVLRGRTYLDPLTFVGRGPVILLPQG